MLLVSTSTICFLINTSRIHGKGNTLRTGNYQAFGRHSATYSADIDGPFHSSLNWWAGRRRSQDSEFNKIYILHPALFSKGTKSWGNNRRTLNNHRNPIAWYFIRKISTRQNGIPYLTKLMFYPLVYPMIGLWNIPLCAKAYMQWPDLSFHMIRFILKAYHKPYHTHIKTRVWPDNPIKLLPQNQN